MGRRAVRLAALELELDELQWQYSAAKDAFPDQVRERRDAVLLLATWEELEELNAQVKLQTLQTLQTLRTSRTVQT